MPISPKSKHKTLAQAIAEVRVYPSQAYAFVHEGLDYTVTRLHGSRGLSSSESHHICGQQLCEGLRDLALSRWGRMARTVLQRWNITSTLDFGQIVYALIEMGQMQKLEDDTIDDFKGVYDFKMALESDYRVASQL